MDVSKQLISEADESKTSDLLETCEYPTITVEDDDVSTFDDFEEYGQEPLSDNSGIGRFQEATDDPGSPTDSLSIDGFQEADEQETIWNHFEDLSEEPPPSINNFDLVERSNETPVKFPLTTSLGTPAIKAVAIFGMLLISAGLLGYMILTSAKEDNNPTTAEPLLSSSTEETTPAVQPSEPTTTTKTAVETTTILVEEVTTTTLRVVSPTNQQTTRATTRSTRGSTASTARPSTTSSPSTTSEATTTTEEEVTTTTEEEVTTTTEEEVTTTTEEEVTTTEATVEEETEIEDEVIAIF